RGGDATGDVQLDPVHGAHVEHDLAVAAAPAGWVVAPAAHRERHPLADEHGDGGGDVVRVERPDDGQRPWVPPGQRELPGGVVAVVRGPYDPAPDALGQPVHGAGHDLLLEHLRLLSAGRVGRPRECARTIDI